MIVFVGFGATFAANPEAFISSQEIVRSVDNSGIITANLENFDSGLK